MTKQDILDYFSDINYAYNDCNKHDDLSRMLDELVETQPCEDCISRQAVLDALESIGSLDTESDKKYARSVFEALPSVTPQPKVGEWLKNGELCKCSRCGSNVLFSAVKAYNYCFRCGARMEVSE